LYADDLVVIAETEEDLIKRLNEWKNNVENRGMRVIMSTTRVINYSSNFLLLEYLLISISGCKFPFPDAVFLQQIDNFSPISPSKSAS